MIVLDTNVVFEARKSTGNPRVRQWLATQAVDELCISAITVLEIQRGIERAAHRGDSRQAGVITTWLENIVLPAFSGRILAIDQGVATALVHGAAVATRNVRHFARSGVTLVNPWDPE